MTGGAHRRHQPRARVGHRWRAGVRYLGHQLAFGQPVADFVGHRAFIVLAHADQFALDAIARQQLAGDTSILGADQVGAGQHGQRAQADVCYVPNRCGHHI